MSNHYFVSFMAGVLFFTAGRVMVLRLHKLGARKERPMAEHLRPKIREQ